MKNIMRDFISGDNRDYKFKIGRSTASSLTGFVVGVICASMIWMAGVNNFL